MYKIIRRKTGNKIVFDLINDGETIAKACRSRNEAEGIQKSLTQNDMAQFVSFSKFDDVKQMAYGIATDETIDVDDEVVSWEGTKKAAADYSQWRNIREMHNGNAVGTADEITLDDVNKKMIIGAHIVDKNAWEKVKSGVYKGFSIGGKKKASEVFKDAGRTLTRITDYIMTEISLVDRPANPSAVFSIIKRSPDMTPEEEAAKKAEAEGMGDEAPAEGGASEEAEAPADNGTATTDELGDASDDVTEVSESEGEGNEDAQKDVPLIEAIVLKMLIKYGLIKPADDGKDEIAMSATVKNLQKSMDGFVKRSELDKFAKAGSLGEFAKFNDLHKLAGDIAKVADAINGVDDRLTFIEKTPRGIGPVLREIGQTGSVPADFQTEAALTALMEKCDNPVLKQELGNQLASMSIRKIQNPK